MDNTEVFNWRNPHIFMFLFLLMLKYDTFSHYALCHWPSDRSYLRSCIFWVSILRLTIYWLCILRSSHFWLPHWLLSDIRIGLVILRNTILQTWLLWTNFWFTINLWGSHLGCTHLWRTELGFSKWRFGAVHKIRCCFRLRFWEKVKI